MSGGSENSKMTKKKEETAQKTSKTECGNQSNQNFLKSANCLVL